MSAGSGVAWRPGNAANISWWNPRLFNHELGHSMSLFHVFEGDDLCSDTPQMIWNYDENCDGDFNDPNDVINGYCWYAKELNVSECNRVAPCTSNHPCCGWDNIDNNVMGDNAFEEAYTACQINRMLDNINSNHCNQVEAVGGLCPPPMPIIEIHPLDNLRENYCSYCLRLEASSNDVLYKVDLYEVTSGGEILINSTNWLEGPAELYCLTTKEEKNGNGVWFGGFKPNTNYRAVLTVENECGTDKSKDLYFTSPPTNCNLAANNITVTPNPVSANIYIDFTIPITSYVRIMHSHSVYGRYNWDIELDPRKPAGTYNLSENVNSWYSGINYVVIQINDKVYSTPIFKQ